MKFAKALSLVVVSAIAIYLGVFLFWIAMGIGCLQDANQQCGQDLMSQTMRITHAPLINLIVNSKN